MDLNQGKKFLHDLANPLTVAILLCERLVQHKSSEKSEHLLVDVKIVERLRSSLEKIEALQSELKFEIQSREQLENKNENDLVA